MLDLYEHSCPKCGANVHQRDLRCPQCKRLLHFHPAIRWTAISVLVLVLGGGLLWAGKRYITNPEEVVHALKKPAWIYARVEPPERAWAYRVEDSLRAACDSASAKLRNNRNVIALLNQQLGTLVRGSGGRVDASAMKLTTEEEQDTLRAFNEADAFMGLCLSRAYNSLSACSAFKDRLESREANECMVVAVKGVLARAPYEACSETAQQPRVRNLCKLTGDRMAAAVAAGNQAFY